MEKKQPMSLAEQLKVQQMYSNKIKFEKTERQLAEDELVKANRKLKKATKKPIIVKDKEGD